MSQKHNFPKTDIHMTTPWKQVNFLTVRANCDFKQTSNEKGQPPHCNLLVSRRLGLAYHICESRAGWWCCGRCAPWVSFWVWLLMGVKVARLVGERLGLSYPICESPAGWWGGGRCAPWCRSGVVAHGVQLLRSGRGCAHLPAWSGPGVSVCFESYTLYIYIIGENKLF